MYIIDILHLARITRVSSIIQNARNRKLEIKPLLSTYWANCKDWNVKQLATVSYLWMSERLTVLNRDKTVKIQSNEPPST